MRRERSIALAFMLTAAFAAAAHAAEEQKLKYHLSKVPAQFGIYVDSTRLEVLSEAPEGVTLPENAGFRPIFARWKTPMAKSGYVLAAFTRSQEKGQTDRLYIDSNCDGSLADEQAVKGRVEEPFDFQAMFGPVKVSFPREGGTTTYHVNVRCSESRKVQLYASLSSACWYASTVSIGGAKYYCTLMDYNANGTFDDASTDIYECDRIRLGDIAEEPKVAGKYLQAGGKLYRLTVARAGASVSFEEAADVPAGTVAAGDKITSLGVFGENGQLECAVKDGKTEVLAGKWVLYDWAITRKDSQGKRWTMTGTEFPNPTAFEVAQGKETQLDIGEPVSEVLEVSKSDKEYAVSAKLVGKLGEEVSISLAGTRVPPNVEISNADGSYKKTFTLQYG